MNRRRFLKGMVAGAGAVGLRAAGQDAREPALTLAVETSMFGRQRVPDVFDGIREAGYRFVELGGAHFRAASASAEAVQQLRGQLGDAGLEAVGAFVVHGIASVEDTSRKAAVERWKRSIEAVQGLGVKTVTTELTGSVKQPKESEAAWRKSMDELLPRFEKADLHLSVEPHPGDFFEAAPPTIQLLRSYRSEHLGYLHCTPHTYHLGPSIREVIRAAGSLLSHVHIADTFRTERIMARSGVGLHLHLRPGLGEVDFSAVFAGLEEVKYRGLVSVQLLSHADAPQAAARQARAYLTKIAGGRLAV